MFTPTLALGTLTGGAGHLRSRFDKNNSDVAEEIASEDGGTIEEAPEATVSGKEAAAIITQRTAIPALMASIRFCRATGLAGQRKQE